MVDQGGFTGDVTAGDEHAFGVVGEVFFAALDAGGEQVEGGGADGLGEFVDAGDAGAAVAVDDEGEIGGDAGVRFEVVEHPAVGCEDGGGAVALEPLGDGVKFTVGVEGREGGELADLADKPMEDGGRGVALAGLHISGGDEADAGVAELDELFEERGEVGEVVGGDAVEGEFGAGGGGGDDGEVVVGEGDVFAEKGLGREEDAAHAAGAADVFEAFGGHAAFADVEFVEAVAQFGGAGGGAADDGGGVGIAVEVGAAGPVVDEAEGGDKADLAGGTEAGHEALGLGVGTVAEFGGDGLGAGAGGGGDAGIVAQGAGNGGGGGAEVTGDEGEAGGGTGHGARVCVTIRIEGVDARRDLAEGGSDFFLSTPFLRSL